MGMRRFWAGYDVLKGVLIGGFCFWFLWVILAAFLEVGTASRMLTDLKAFPDQNYVGLIESLQAEGKLSEAYEMAQFVVNQPGMPGQEECQLLSEELDHELHSLAASGA